MLPPRLCGSVDYYACAWLYGNYVQDWGRRFDKREKEAHRFTIADTHGKLSLTVPISKPDSSLRRWDEIYISTHGAWWDVHRVALESAYGRTPFFEFYIDRFIPMLTVGVESRFPTLASLALAWDAEIRNILTLPPAAAFPSSSEQISAESKSLELASSELTSSVLPSFVPISSECLDSANEEPYYQVRAGQLGFIPHLSILDLIFNLGPESPLYLNALFQSLKDSN